MARLLCGPKRFAYVARSVATALAVCTVGLLGLDRAIAQPGGYSQKDLPKAATKSRSSRPITKAAVDEARGRAILDDVVDEASEEDVETTMPVTRPAASSMTRSTAPSRSRVDASRTREPAEANGGGGSSPPSMGRVRPSAFENFEPEEGEMPRAAADEVRSKRAMDSILKTSASEQELGEVDLEEALHEVIVEGNVTIPSSDIARHIKTRPGRAATPTMIKNDVDALVRTRWFANVEPYIRQTPEGIVLVFRVLERPIVTKVEYVGNKKVKTKVFDGMTNLKVGSPFDVSANKECARRIEAYYHEKGYSFATVELESGGHPDDREVIFRIQEGPKVVVRKVSFEGNKFFSDPILATKKRTKTQLLWVFGGKYDPASIQDDIAALRQYYHGLGFFDVKIEPHEKFSEDKSKVDISYTITEGGRYRIRNIEVFGNGIVTEPEIREKLTFAPGEHFNAKKLSDDVDKVRDIYGEQGRLFATVDAIPVFLEEPGEVDVKLQIQEDKVYVVREFRVHVLGDHPHTRTHLVRNISRIHPGDLADPKKINQTKARLGGSQYFENTPQAGPRLEISKVDGADWLASKGNEERTARGQNSGPYFVERFNPNANDDASEVMPPDAGAAHGTARAGGHSSPLRSGSPVGLEPRAGQKSMGAEVPAGKAPISQKLVSAPAQQETSATHPAAVPVKRNNTPEYAPTKVVPFLKGIGSGSERGQGAARQEQRTDLTDPDTWLTPAVMQSPVFRGQSRDFTGPLQGRDGVLNQGDPLGSTLRNPDDNVWNTLPPPEYIDIDAYVNEARTGRLMFGAGVNSNAGLVGNIVLSESNFDLFRPPTSIDDIINGTAFRGAGQRFRIEALPGTQVSRYVVDWSDPYFLDTDYNFGVSGFYYQRFFESWNEERYGGRIRIGRQLNNYWSTSASLRLEQVELSGAPSVRPQILSDALGSNFLSTIRLSIAHDTRDVPFLPTSGHFIEASYEQAFNDFKYPRFEVDATQYFTTYRRADGAGKHILSLRGQLGWTGDSTPIFERFYAGGFQSFRGFRFRGVSPVDTGVRVGGQTMLLGGAEYQIPVTANEMIQVVGFTDFGTIQNNFGFDEFRLSVGGGLRITVPAMGPVPIALDWAVPITKEGFDRTQVFSFYVGVAR
jgi:outer membrane protein insertion porin family